MNHRTLTFLGLLAAIALTTALANALVISIAPPRNEQGAIVIALTSPGTVGSRLAPSICPEVKRRLDFLIADLPEGFYAVVVFALRD